MSSDLEIYLKYHEKSAVGVDMEWKPTRLESDVIIPSILQIAIDDHITILDLYTLCYLNKECIFIYTVVIVFINFINNYVYR